MRKFSTHRLGAEQGSTILFSDYQNGGQMWAGSGPRVFRVSVPFEQSFQSPPMVHVAISMWDFASETNQRADISAEDITKEGFDIVFRTWGDTKVARARADWMALGEVRDESDWDV